MSRDTLRGVAYRAKIRDRCVCGRMACYEVFDQTQAPRGRFCITCADREVARLNRELQWKEAHAS